MKSKTRIIAACIFGLMGLLAALLGKSFSDILIRPLLLFFFAPLISFCWAYFLIHRNFSRTIWGILGSICMFFTLSPWLDSFANFLKISSPTIVIPLFILIFPAPIIFWHFLRKSTKLKTVSLIIDRGLIITLFSIITFLIFISLFVWNPRNKYEDLFYIFAFTTSFFIFYFSWICFPLGILASFLTQFFIPQNEAKVSDNKTEALSKDRILISPKKIISLVAIFYILALSSLGFIKLFYSHNDLANRKSEANEPNTFEIPIQEIPQTQGEKHSSNNTAESQKYELHNLYTQEVLKTGQTLDASWIPLYDSRIDKEEKELPQAVQKKILSKVYENYKSYESCRKNNEEGESPVYRIRSVSEGFFRNNNIHEKIYLVEVGECLGNPEFFTSELILYNSKTNLYENFEIGRGDQIIAIKDFNHNGLQELLIASSSFHQGAYTYASIYEWSVTEKKFVSPHSFNLVYSSTCSMGQGEHAEILASKIYYSEEKSTKFMLQNFQAHCLKDGTDPKISDYHQTNNLID